MSSEEIVRQMRASNVRTTIAYLKDEIIGDAAMSRKYYDNTAVITPAGSPQITLGQLKSRLHNLERNLEEEGAYTRANTVWLALEALKLLQGLK